MKKLVFITSIFPSYRKFLIDELSYDFDITIIASDGNKNSGFLTPQFEKPNISFIKVDYKSLLNQKFFYQKKLIHHIKKIKPDYIIISASLRDYGYWSLLIYCFLKGIKLVSHGQGPFNKSSNLISKIQYNLVNFLSFKHIVYTEYSLSKMKSFGINTNKTRAITNTILNSSPIKPENKLYNTNEILFIGRLRKGSGLEILIDSVINLTDTHPSIKCHVIGGGELEGYYKQKYNNVENIVWHGKVYDDSIISNISKNCKIACYPGNTGLSVVHYLSLSLPVIIHDNIESHQGPEATYIKDNYNGLLYTKDNIDSLQYILTELLSNEHLCSKLGQNAYNSYIELSNPSYASKFIKELN